MTIKSYINSLSTEFEKWKKEASAIHGKGFVRMREYYGLTQEQLAEAAGKHHNTISNIEIGKSQLKQNEFYAYARVAQACSLTLGIKTNREFKVDSWNSFLDLNDELRKHKDS